MTHPTRSSLFERTEICHSVPLSVLELFASGADCEQSAGRLRLAFEADTCPEALMVC